MSSTSPIMLRSPHRTRRLGALVSFLCVAGCDGGGGPPEGGFTTHTTVIPVSPPAFPASKGTGAAADAPGEGLFIRPYLTGLDVDSARINWRLKSPAPSRIAYGRTFDLEAGAIELAEATQHGVLLSGLAADTIYHYRVDNTFGGSFRTESGEGPLRFSVIGHTHGSEHYGHYPDRLTAARMRELGVHFGLHAGDATFYNNAHDFREFFFDVFADFLAETPLYLAPGNHDAGWPFIYGRSLMPFKELFPYPYPEPIRTNEAEAFYAIEKRGLKLLFLSYTSRMGKNSLQRRWLRGQLEGSTADFNVLVYGGANRYYDEGDFLQFLSEFRVDAIFNGDGSVPAEPWRRVHDIPIYFTGAKITQPHPLIYCEYRPEVLTVKLLDSSGRATKLDWIHTKLRHPSRVALALPDRLRVTERRLRFKFVFDQPVSTENVRGMQLLFDMHTDREPLIYAFVEPHDRDGRGEPGFRTQYGRLGPHDSMVTLPFTRRKPHGGESFGIRSIDVVVDGVEEAGEIVFRDAYLY